MFAGTHRGPIPVVSVAIVRHKGGRRESFTLEFYDCTGTRLECLQFETLEIALDQAAALVGLGPQSWSEGCGQ